jgi:hypothetical protein
MSSLVFPTLRLGIDIQRETIFRTTVYEAPGGGEQRVAWMSAPRYRYKLRASYLRGAGWRAGAHRELEALHSFYVRHLGAWDSFLFADPDDRAVVAHAFGIGDGVTTAFHLQRTLAADADLPGPGLRSYWPLVGDGYEPVTEPVAGFEVHVAGALASPLTDYTIGAAGALTFASPPASGAVLTWTGSFRRRVRFEKDALTLDRIVHHLWKGDLALISTGNNSTPYGASIPWLLT